MALTVRELVLQTDLYVTDANAALLFFFFFFCGKSHSQSDTEAMVSVLRSVIIKPIFCDDSFRTAKLLSLLKLESLFYHQYKPV